MVATAAALQPQRDGFLRDHWYAVGFPEDFGC